MVERRFTVQGSEANGYMVVQLVEGEYLSISKRYGRYDEACKALNDIREDNEE